MTCFGRQVHTALNRDADMAMSIPASWLQPAGLKNEGVLGMLMDRSTAADSKSSSSTIIDPEIPAAQPEPGAAAEVEEAEEVPGLAEEEEEEDMPVEPAARAEDAQALELDDDDAGAEHKQSKL